MKSFTAKVRDPSGRLTTLKQDALNSEQLRSELRRSGYLVVDVKKEATIGAGGVVMRRKNRPASILRLLREMRTIIDAGIPVTEALVMIETRPNDARLSSVLHDVNGEVRRGKALHEAMRERPDVFDPALAMTFQIGMSTGGLADALERYEADLKMRLELSRKFRKAMVYPVFLLVLLAVVLVILFVSILPNFVELYDEFGADLPYPTQLLISAVDTAPIWIAGLVIFGLLIWLSRRGIAQVPKGKLWLDKRKLVTPVFGRIRSDSLMAQLASSLSLLLYSGMPLKQAVGLVRESLRNSFLSEKLKEVEAGLSSGRRFSELTKESALFGGASYGLLQAGERAGALDQMLHHVAQLHEQELSDRVDLITSLLEPVMMVVIGGVIGVIVVVVYLPIFGVTNVVQ